MGMCYKKPILRMFLAVFLLFCLIAYYTYAQLAGSAWPAFLSDSRHDSQSSSVGPDYPEIEWTYPDAGSPVIGADGTVYFACDGYAYALNPDGTLKWKEYYGVFSLEAAGADGTVYALASGHVYALNSDGTLYWDYDAISDTVGLVVGDDGDIYVNTDWNEVAINSDGTFKWESVSSSSPFYWNASPLVLGADTVLFYRGHGSYLPYNLVSYTGSTGSANWEKEIFFAPETELIASKDGGFSASGELASGSFGFECYDGSGNPLWDHETGNTSDALPVGILRDDTGALYTACGDGSLYCLDSDGGVNWHKSLGANVSAAPVLDANETMYVVAENGYLYAYYPHGVEKWRFDTGLTGIGDLIAGGGGVLYVTSDTGLHKLGVSSLYTYFSVSRRRRRSIRRRTAQR